MGWFLVGGKVMDFYTTISVHGTIRSSKLYVSPFLNYTQDGLVGRCFLQLIVEWLLLILVFIFSNLDPHATKPGDNFVRIFWNSMKYIAC